MPALLTEKRISSSLPRPRFYYAKEELVSNRSSNVRHSVSPATNDEELAYVKKAVILFAILGMTPLILFHIVNFFFPDLFLVPITPN